MNDMKKLSFPQVMGRAAGMVVHETPVYFVIYVILNVAFSVSFGLVTLLNQRFIDAVTAVIGGSSLAGAVMPLVLFGGLTILLEVLRQIHQFLYQVFTQKCTGRLAEYLHKRAALIPAVSFEDPAFLDTMNKANEGRKKATAFVMDFLTIFTGNLPYLIFMCIYLYSLKPSLALAILVIFVPVLVSYLFRTNAYKRLEDTVAPVRREYEYYDRCITDREYFKETRLLGAYGFFARLYQHSVLRFARETARVEYRSGAYRLISQIITLAGYLGVLFLLFDGVMKEQITIGAFAAVFASIGRMLYMIQDVFDQSVSPTIQNYGVVSNSSLSPVLCAGERKQRKR